MGVSLALCLSLSVSLCLPPFLLPIGTDTHLFSLWDKAKNTCCLKPLPVVIRKDLSHWALRSLFFPVLKRASACGCHSGARCSREGAAYGVYHGSFRQGLLETSFSRAMYNSLAEKNTTLVEVCSKRKHLNSIMQLPFWKQLACSRRKNTRSEVSSPGVHFLSCCRVYRGLKYVTEQSLVLISIAVFHSVLCTSTQEQHML